MNQRLLLGGPTDGKPKLHVVCVGGTSVVNPGPVSMNARGGPRGLVLVK